MVSIFIPIYNGEKYLSKTLNSLLSQTFSDFEILCVDDTSTDSSLKIIRDYAKTDSRIKVYMKPNGGDAPHSWQYVFPLLKGDFTMYMSQDDLLESDTLQKLVNRQQDTGADAVIPTVVFYEEGKTYREVRVDKGVDGDLSKVLTGHEALNLMMDYSIPGFALWRTEIIKKVGMRIEAYNSDEVAQREWVSKCQKVAFSDGLFLFRRDNENCITRTFSDKQFSDALSKARLIELAIENNIDKDSIQKYRDYYYQELWWYTVNTRMNRRNLAQRRYRELKTIFSNAYDILHIGVSLDDWKYKYSSKNKVTFWILVELKAVYATIKDILRHF